jgi:hypothetical protein
MKLRCNAGTGLPGMPAVARQLIIRIQQQLTCVVATTQVDQPDTFTAPVV